MVYFLHMKLKISTSQTQKQVLAPAMQQSIAVLMLSLGELNTTIEQELQSNPMLEADTLQASGKRSDISNLSGTSLSNKEDKPLQTQTNYDDTDQAEIPIEQNRSLEDSLMDQLRLEITDPLQLKIGECMIGNLDADGYLSTPIEEIAWLCKTKDIPLVEKVLRTIQQFDPVGIASRDVKECLINQAQASRSVFRSSAITMLSEHFELLFQKKFDHIAKKMSISLEKVTQVARFISTLEPKPARNAQGSQPTVYVQPDVYVLKDNAGNLQIQVNKNETPIIRVNPMYLKLINDPRTSEKDRKFMQEKLTNAMNFIKSIQQRGETLRQISQMIVERQKPFFEERSSSLSPLALKDIAQALGRNESTISRAVHNKYMQTSLGLFPLRFFFSHAVNGANRGISAHDIKEEIRLLINTENKDNPLTDQEILESFKGRGIIMARRTINKYRQELDIPPSHFRKRSA